jgi:hypothetical protein
MSYRQVKYTSLAIGFFPGNRNDCLVNPVVVLTCKRCGGQNFHIWIHMHVILFRTDFKVFDAAGYRIIFICDFHRIVNDIHRDALPTARQPYTGILYFPGMNRPGRRVHLQGLHRF